MKSIDGIRRNKFLAWTGLTIAAMAIGCQEESGIETYRVAKSQFHSEEAALADPDADRGPEPAPSVAPALPITFQTPDPWQAAAVSSTVAASFTIHHASGPALVTINSFPADAGPKMTDREANLIRWRGQVGLPPAAAEEVDDAFDTIPIGGVAGHYAVIDGPVDPPPRRGIRIAFVERDGRIWFFKLTGNFDAVEQETGNFRSFLDSIQFDTNQEG